MNYLAHAFLSGDDKHLLVGNFIADHIRGSELSGFPLPIIEGVMLHRRIDTFTDSHPEFRQAKRLFYDGFEKHSGILVDIYFDHLLARDFEPISGQPLEEFSNKVYQVYQDHQHLLPQGSSRFLHYVVKNNIYQSYASREGIQQVLYHLSQRIRHGVQLQNSMHLFIIHQDKLQGHFERFLNDLLMWLPQRTNTHS